MTHENHQARLADALAEVAFWRREASARLWIGIALHANAGSDEDKAAHIRVTYIMPVLAALRDADAKKWQRDDGADLDDAQLRAEAMALVDWT